MKRFIFFLRPFVKQSGLKKLALGLTFIVFVNIFTPALLAAAEEAPVGGSLATGSPGSLIPDSATSADTATGSPQIIIIVNPPSASSTPGIAPAGNVNQEQATSTPELQIKPKEEPKAPPVSYIGLMHEVLAAKQSRAGALSPDLQKKIARFIGDEKERLAKLNLPAEKQLGYLNFLQSYLPGAISSTTPTRLTSGNALADQIPPALDIKIPEHPGVFSFDKGAIQLQKFGSITLKQDQIARLGGETLADAPSPVGLIMPPGFTASAPDNAFLPTAGINALADEDLPTAADVNADGAEVVIDQSFFSLASSLENNPVKIYNFVRSTIEYEPYFGAKKGALGCLKERLCNDVDASSLTIALLRSAGIPARYKKELAVMSVDQLKKLLGVDETKTVYAALFRSKIPAYLISTGTGAPPDFETFDFSSVSQLAVEWVYVEAFYDYDERGGNIPNTLSFANATSTEQIQALLQPFSKKQWLALDAVVKPYGRTKNEIVPDTVSFNTQNFWNNYLTSQGGQSPLDKYISDLQSASGKNVGATAYQSFRKPLVDELQILPPSLPYNIGISSEFTPETWSVLPNGHRAEVTITLKKDSDQSVVLKQKFFGSEINNQPLNLFYKGASENDREIIDSYGGIHATPAQLVDIAPYFSVSSAESPAPTPVKIGETLVMQFDYGMDGQVQHSDQKFSVAGNQEGIYVSLSRPQTDPLIDNDPSKVLLEGNPAIARNFLARITSSLDAYKKALDVSVNIKFSRAVVTQNRVLNSVGGLPTTFDFKGMTLDASSYFANYSNRSNYKDHDKDLHLLFGLDASFHEGQIFNDLANLEGISTVKGLRYAAANPSAYTVYTIAQSNESQIDALQLSANTKQNMHADVQSGNTIITPDKPITDGAFSGILYISLAPDGTGTYAIGEQSQQNGGFTTNSFSQTHVYDENSDQLRFTNEGTSSYFIYADNILGGDTKCSISKTDYFDILNSPDYLPKYGLPCLKNTKIYPAAPYSYILLTDGARFASPGIYDYWKTERLVKAILEADKNNDNPENLQYINLDGQFKFDVVAGTYSQEGNYAPNRRLVSFYQPDQNARGFGRIVYGTALGELSQRGYDNNSYFCNVGDLACISGLHSVQNILGFPTSNLRRLYNTDDDYQSFIGGEIYINRAFFGDETYYIPGPIADYYKQVSIGAPSNNPVLKSDNVTVKQDFEKGSGITWNTALNIVSTEYAGKYYCDETPDPDGKLTIAKAFIEGLWDGGSSFLKGAIVFTLAVGGAGAIIDAAFGTHGGATIAGLAAVGTAVIVALVEVEQAGLSNILTGVDQQIQFEIIHSNCKSRKVYLLAKYVPQFAVVVIGLKKLIADTPEALQGFNITNNIFTLSSDATVPAARNVFITNLNLFKASFLNGDSAIGEIVDNAQTKFNQETAGLVKQYNRALTKAELNGIATKDYPQTELGTAKLIIKSGKLTIPNAYFNSSDNLLFKVRDIYLQNTRKLWKNPNLTLDYVRNGNILPEADYYGLADNDLKLFDAPYLKSKYGLTKIRYSLSDLKQLLSNYQNIYKNIDPRAELKFVLKQNGEMVFGIGENANVPTTNPEKALYLPHPALANGESVLAAGDLTLNPDNPNEIWVTNETGHYQTLKPTDSLVVDKLKSSAFNAVDKGKYYNQ